MTSQSKSRGSATHATIAREKTLVLLKPDAVERNLIGALIQRFEQAGLKVGNCRWLLPSRAMLSTHYADLKKKNPRAFARTVASLAGKPFLAVRLSGPNAILKTRALVGPTDPLKAPAGTIRGDYGADSIDLADQEDRATDNLVHASDSPASAKRELALWFQ
jgi:nucleoside-diphosphate kinase